MKLTTMLFRRLLASRAVRSPVGLLARVVGALAVLLALVGPVRERLEARRHQRQVRRARARRVLTSLYDRYPNASAFPRRPRGLQAVPVEQIVGTVRNPSQNLGDFQPLPQLRGRNWDARWQRITRATERLEMLPPVELVKIGDEYFVADGHNRVAAALDSGALAIDADVIELVRPGEQSAPSSSSISTSLVGAEELRQAAAGRHSRASQQRVVLDQVSRRDLLRASGEHPRPAGEETDVHPVVDEGVEDREPS